MIKTRQGTKRAALNKVEHENKNACTEKKKSKTESPSTSKYFDTEDLQDNKLKKKIQNLCVDSAESIDYKCEEVSEVKYESDSDSSSSDEFMKAPFSLDELGRFENCRKEIVKEVNQKEPSCSLDKLHSSGNSGDEKETSEHQYYDFSQIIKSQQLLIDTQNDTKTKIYEQNHVPVSTDSKAKAVKKSTTTKRPNIGGIQPRNDELGVSELLYMTEGPNLKSNQIDDCSLGVSSENEDTHFDKTYSVPKEGVQVTIELPNLKQKRKSKGFDVEAAMKRRINLIKKENQIFIHKVHVLCWIAHCIYLNRTINNDSLLGIALSLIPSKHCYPPKHADLSYLEKLVDWFVTKVIVDKDHKHALNSSNLPLLDVLETSISVKVAFSVRDLVLIFACMVRSLGISARLVVSLRPVPLRPSVNDLCQVSSNSSSCSKPNKLACTTKVKKNSSVNNTEKSQPSARPTRKSHSDTKQGSHYFEELKHEIKVNKQKGVGENDIVTKQSGNIQSPYFSLSDEIPLSKLNCQRPHIEVTQKKAQETLSNKNKSPKPRIVLKSSMVQSNSALKVKSLTYSKLSTSGIDKSTIKSLPKSCQKGPLSVEKQPIIKSDSRSKVGQKQLKTEKNDDNIKIGLTEKRVKRSNPKLCHQQLIDSSEEELEVLKIIPNKKNKDNSKPNSSDSTQKKVVSRKSKCSDISDDVDFELPKPSTSKKKSLDRRVLSSDEDSSCSKKIGNDFWVEVFLEAEEKWITVDLVKKKVHCIQQLYNGATQPVRYVLACNNDGSLKDVTRRYAPQWLTVTRKQRADDKWWQETIRPYLPHRTQRDRDEDEDLDRQMHDKPLPTSITEYKNHPLFALRRNLLKFEAIYPPDAPPFGFVRGEPVYSRGCVVELHAREAWIKEAKVVRLGEEPYKIVKARPKWDKLSQTVINDLPLPLFGHWQVEDYIPPPAVNGKVPRNQYGNVELYKPCMLPPGTVHLQVPMLGRVARKLDIDCAPAVVGWEFSGGTSHPVLDGFVVCEEFQDVLLDAWNKEVDETAKRAKDKVEQRVYGNWKRLIKGLLIRERLKHRYDFGSPAPEEKKKKQNPKAGTSKS